MTRSIDASLASINANINWLKREIESIVTEANPADIQVALRDIACRPLNLMEIPDYRNKMKDADHELVKEEIKLLDEYNEFKIILYRVLKAGYQLDILKVDEVLGELDKVILPTKQEKTKTSLLTDFPYPFQYSGSYHTAYTVWLLWEFVNYWDQQKWAYERLQTSLQKVSIWVTNFKEEIIQNHLQFVLDNTGKSAPEFLGEEQLRTLPEEEQDRLARKMNEYDKFKQALKESGVNPLTSVVNNIGESFPMGRIPKKDIYLYTSWILDEMAQKLAESWENWGSMLNEYY